MRQPSVLLRLPDGGVARLGHGDLIGRVWSAALPIQDPRVSEAHAMISLRGGELWVLSLRRRVAVHGRPVPEARLEPGLRIDLAEGLALVVVAVELPDAVLGVAAGSLPPVALPAVCSVRIRPVLSFAPRFEPEAPCRIWTDGEGWWRDGAGGATRLDVGDRWTVEGVELVAVAVPLAGSGPDATRVTGGVSPPLRLVANWDTAQLHVGDGEPLVFAGLMARILTELVQLGGPAPWEVVARSVWPDERDAFALRKRWDVTLGRLRARLKEARVGHELVRSVGTGQVELVLRHGDVAEDRA